jgi:hypothetical protein
MVSRPFPPSGCVVVVLPFARVCLLKTQTQRWVCPNFPMSTSCATSRYHRAFSSNDDRHLENQVLDSRAPQIDLIALAGSGAGSDFERDRPARFGHAVSVT